jgi:hypothetical protein
MMRTVLLQTRAVPTDPAAALQTLQSQEIAYTVQMSDAIRKLRDAQDRYDRTDGAQKQAAGDELSQFEARIALNQQRLGNVREQIAQLKREGVTSTSGDHATTGTAVADERWRIFGRTPTEFYNTAGFILLFPLVLAFARRIWRGGSARRSNGTALDGDPQINRLERAVEAIAIEVERISEAQRFSAKLLAERPVEAKAEPAAKPSRSRRPVITPVP